MLKKFGWGGGEEEEGERSAASRDRLEEEEDEEGLLLVKSEETRTFTLSITTITGFEPRDDQGTVISRFPTVMCSTANGCGSRFSSMALMTSSFAVRFDRVTNPDHTSMERFVDDDDEEVKYLERKEVKIREKKDSNIV